MMNNVTSGSGGGVTVTITQPEWTYRLTWRQRLRYLWYAIRGRETIR